MFAEFPSVLTVIAATGDASITSAWRWCYRTAQRSSVLQHVWSDQLLYGNWNFVQVQHVLIRCSLYIKFNSMILGCLDGLQLASVGQNKWSRCSVCNQPSGVLTFYARRPIDVSPVSTIRRSTIACCARKLHSTGFIPQDTTLPTNVAVDRPSA